MRKTFLTFCLERRDLWLSVDTRAVVVRPKAGSSAQLKTEYNEKVANPFASLPTEGDDYPVPPFRGVSMPGRHNQFLRSAVSQIGGGEAELLNAVSSNVRRGGGGDDGMKYVHLCDRDYPAPCDFLLPVETSALMFGITRGCVSRVSTDVVAQLVTHHTSSHPGPTLRALGFRKKNETLPVAYEMASRVFSRAQTQEIGDYLVPRYALSGRPKVKPKDKFDKKAAEGQPLGRAVWMVDGHEPLIAAAYTQPLYAHLYREFRVIANGFNKFTSDPHRLWEKFKGYNTFISTDFESFDLSVGPKLVIRAFDVVRLAFDAPRGTGGVDDRVLAWLENEIIFSRVVLPTGRTVMKHGAIPSGSGMTALLGSIINGLVFADLRARGMWTGDFMVQGDDNIIALDLRGDFATRRKEGRALLKRWDACLQDVFGLKINADKSHVGLTFFVGYATPRVPKDIADGSRLSSSLYQFHREKELGRKLTFDELFEVLPSEPVGPHAGRTHRWSYLFHERAKFLSQYFKESATGGLVTCVRPLRDTVTSLLCPSEKVPTLDDHLMRVRSALVDNWGSLHVQNHLMHYFFDAYCLKKAGVLTEKGLRAVDAGLVAGKSREQMWWLEHRAWYRRVTRKVDILSEEPEFALYWGREMDVCRHVWETVFNRGPALWHALRLYERGVWGTSVPRALCGPSIWLPPDEMQRLSAQPLFQMAFALWQRWERVDLIVTTLEDQMRPGCFNKDSEAIQGLSREIAILRSYLP